MIKLTQAIGINNKNHQGYTIVELLVSMAIGLLLLAGVLSIFVGMRVTSEETSSYGELQENGRFAISLLTEDLLRQDFWGDYTGTLNISALNGQAPGAPANECVGEGVNNGTFPAAAGHFRTLWGQTAATADPLGCFAASAPAFIGSDILQLKRTISDEVLPAQVSPNNYYLITNINDGEIFLGNAAIPTIDNAKIWQYQHHVYYVTEQAQGGYDVPVLMQGRLTTTMSFAPIIDGIEYIRFMYGLDTDNDGIVNNFLSAGNMNQNDWDRSGNNSIIAVKIYVLARSISPDNDYTNDNTYTLGDIQITPNDNFRRLLFTSTVTLFNARVDSWPR
ncbi:PilW family protein [Thalassotalea sp. PP2-459]|uniref:PilW family protein n=1 Tax=Thalassotalea sp. PP2-459 TaxID=1742724 RepID=UPI000942F9DE|nr:PilW family protein [Thalassotalea sp. PP2-459]OKY25755.1 prepilin-type N-terminal cleavage/methylation domain-containing protein [Thalassotalea sp. PP2-459]